jgi:hypothetical protein
MMSGGDARGTERTKEGHRRRARRGAGGGAPHGRTARERDAFPVPQGPKSFGPAGIGHTGRAVAWIGP